MFFCSRIAFLYVTLLLFWFAGAQDPPPLPLGEEDCDGIILSYTFISRAKEFPYVKNATGQSWAFKSEATITNAGTTELDSWKLFIGFQHNEILVSATGAVPIDGSDFPAAVGNGTTLAGYPQANLKTAIDTAGDNSQIQVRIEMTGTLFGLKPPGTPLPRTIALVNDGFKCPRPHLRGASSMYACCTKDPKFKLKEEKKKFLRRLSGDLSLTYDVLQAYGNNYLAQVTIDNNSTLGRLDHWNLTWEWMRGEFINTMRGAYTHKKDVSGCIYGPAAQIYQGMDFSQVMNCEKKPIIADLPADRAKDEKIGNLPYCCRNGSLLPAQMDKSKSRSLFQLQVFKLPPDMNRTALNPPQKWKINGDLNPSYQCGPPVRVAPSEFPDPSGLPAITYAIASWQVVCNITQPKGRRTRCCVSYSAYYDDSVIPCSTCACGCGNSGSCDPKAKAMLLPGDALLIPFENRTAKAKAWAKLKHRAVPGKLPCPDNCGVSINWHIVSDYLDGWSARITLFNWGSFPFEDWFTAVQMDKAAMGFQKVYSFNGSLMSDVNDTIFFQGLEGLNYLIAETNGSNPATDPRVPGKLQSVISFTKKNLRNLRIKEGDGFPTKVFFNGEQCALPTDIPSGSGGHISLTNTLSFVCTLISTLVLVRDWLH